MPFAHSIYEAIKDAILPDFLRPTPHRNLSSPNQSRSRSRSHSRPRTPLLISRAAPRHPGTYTRMDAATGLDTDKPLHDTQEFMHASVRIRSGCPKLSEEDEGPYQPAALEGWRVVQLGKGKGDARWIWKQGEGEGEVVLLLPEDVLGPNEQRLLELFYVDDPAGVPEELKMLGQAGAVHIV